MAMSRPVVDDDLVEDPGELDQNAVGYHRVEHSAWSPAQFFALAVGLFLVVFGGVALARTGLTFHHIPSTHVQVAGFHQTSLSAGMELLAGAVLLGAGAVPGAARGMMAFVAVVLIAGGLVVAIQPSSFHRYLGYHERNGVLFVALGTVVLLGAVLSPVVWSSRQRAVVDNHSH